MRFTFNMEDIHKSRMIPWSKQHPGNMPYTETPAETPMLWLVKDSGVYLMAGSGERQAAEVDKDGKLKRCVVVYAKNHGPEVHVGGDDFVQSVPVDMLEDFKKEVTITLTSTHLTVQGI